MAAHDPAPLPSDRRQGVDRSDPAFAVEQGLDLLARGDATAAAEGVRWIERAADAGTPDGLLLSASLHAIGAAAAPDWNRALDRLLDAARRGVFRAQGQLRALAGDERSTDWSALRQHVDVAAWLAPPQKTAACEAPRIRTVSNFLPRAACRWLIAQARGRLAPATMYNPKTGRDEPHPRRTNETFLFDLRHADVVTAVVRARISALVGVPLPCFEPTQIFHYGPGQEIGPHYDYLERNRMVNFDDGKPYEGQRIVTCLVYLNDDFEGGETDFPLAPWRFRPTAGDALYFANVDPSGQPDSRSLHAGLPPTSGEKWIVSQWIHNRAFTGVNG